MAPLKAVWIAVSSWAVRFGREARRRFRLCWRVARQGVPLWDEIRYREWNRVHDRPAFMDVYDLATNQLLFTVIVWPDLRADHSLSQDLQHSRARKVFKAFQHAAPELAGATSWETDFSPIWHRRREVWIREDLSAYEGPEFT